MILLVRCEVIFNHASKYIRIYSKLKKISEISTLYMILCLYHENYLLIDLTKSLNIPLIVLFSVYPIYTQYTPYILNIPYIPHIPHIHLYNSNFRQFQRPDGPLHHRRLPTHGPQQNPHRTPLQIQILHLALSLGGHLRIQSFASSALSKSTSLVSDSESGDKRARQNFGRVQA